MAVKLGDAYVAIGTKDELDKGLNAARRKVDGFLSNLTQGIGQGIGQAVANAAGRAIGAVVNEMGKAVNAASDLNESLNKTNVAFANSAQEILDWSRTSATAFGQSRGQALEAAASFGLLFRTMGLTSEASADMSIQLTELASDLASINNISPEEALIKLRAGLVGEIEPLRTVGVLLSANVVEQKALALGLAETTAEITEQDKVLARYQLILDQTTLAQGDFARTSDELANSQRILAAQIEDSSARFGQALLPLRLAFVQGLSELIRIVEPYGANIMDSLALGLAKGIKSVLPVLMEVRALFAYWLKPGSPPRLLKELTDWGQSAMQEYLRGWTLADFDALRTVGGMVENVIRSFAGSGDIAETDLVGRVFGTTRSISEAVREFRALGFVSESTLGRIADAAGPAGTEIAGLVREYFELQEATEGVARAQQELNSITDRYSKALDPVNKELDAVRARQQTIRENQRLEELGEIIRDPRADVDERQLARLEAQEIQLERQARALEDERDVAVDAAQEKLNAAKKEEDAQRQRYQVAQEALDQQVKVNALVEEETTLRLRLANEALAAEEKRRRELESAQRAEAAELERIADAQLRYRLATADSAGQLAILQDELSKVAVGSADYYNILTQIATLEERIAKERGGGADLFPSIEDMVGSPAEIEQQSKGVQALASVMEEVFAIIKGEEGKTVEISPQWKAFGDSVTATITDIGNVVTNIRPIIDGFIGLFTGENKDVPTADILRPVGAGGGGFFSSIVPGLRGLISALTLIRDGDWSALWNGFKSYITEVLTQISPESDPRSFGFYSWLQDSLIPAINALAVGDWKLAWDNLAEAPVAAFQNIITKIQELFDLEERIKSFMERFGIETLPFNNFAPGQDVLPDSPFASFPGITPQLPATAGVAAIGGTSADSHDVYYIEQNISTNGDFGGARQGANEGIRQALLQRRLQGA